MTTHLLPLALSAPIPSPLKKKRVLLVDLSASKRELRAEIMKKLGMEVDCAADISEARCWWRADLYDLVLIDVENNGGQRDEFCGDIRRATPPQQIAFFVGKPEYLADSPTAEPGSLVEKSNRGLLMNMSAALPSEFRGPPPFCGIMEASRRISAVRSAAVARTQAMRNLPAPPRDSEGRSSKRSTMPASLDDLLREEMR